MELHIGKYGATRQSWSRTSIRVTYAEIKASRPKANHTILVRLLAERMRDDDDALMAAADYIATNCEEAETGYAKRRKSRKKRAEVAEEIETTAEAIKNQILLLNLEMPNGKRMRFCTGTEVGKFGKAYQRIAKRVGSKTVGTVLNEAEIRKLMQ